MKIALDVHGVLSDNECMIPVVKELKDEGHELYIISGAPKREIEVEIVMLGYQPEWFTGIYSIIDWLIDWNIEGKIWHDENGWWFEDDAQWWKTKSEIAEYYEIDILLDDQEKYRQGYLKPGTFTLYSTFKSFKGWSDPSSFLLMIASYYRPAPPWKLVAKEDVPVQKMEPPTGMIFYMDPTFKDPNKESISEERQKELSLISALHKLYPHIGLAQARRFLIDSNWDWCKAVKLAKNYKKVMLYKEEKDPAESSVVIITVDVDKNRNTQYTFKKPWEDSNE